MLAPIYIAELSPPAHRGKLVSFNLFAIFLGQSAAFYSNFFLRNFGGSDNWRWMLGVMVVPSFLLFVSLLFVPESPRWLVERHRDEPAIRILTRINGTAEADREFKAIAESVQNEDEGKLSECFHHGMFGLLMIGIMLAVFQQVTGINVVMYYAPRIFQAMGYATAAQMWFTAAVGLTNVLATFIAIAYVDRWGRKPILYAGFAVMAVGLGVVGTLMHLGITTEGEQVLAVVMLLIFIVGFAMSAGPLVWTLCSEIQPLKGRDFGIGASTLTNWVVNWVVGNTFLTLLNTFGRAQTFWLYAVLNASFLLFTYALVPETKGVTLEQIERKLMSGARLRDIGR